MKKLSLQWRITILTALVLLICTVTLTTIAIHNAEKSFMEPISESAAINVIPAIPIEKGSVEQYSQEVAMVATIAAKRQFDLNSIFFCILFTALGTTAVYFVTGRALLPLRHLSEQVDVIDEHTLSVRLPEALSKDEVSTLTIGFNRMLARLDDAFLRQKRFTANAAHELKTPLATLKTGAQVLKTDQNAKLPDYQENLERTLISVDRLSKIVNDLLLLASAGEAMGEETEEVWLDPLFDAIGSELSLLLSRQHMNYYVECNVLSIYGNSSLLYRVFFNLIENACKYGKENTTIWISAAQNTNEVAISVKDDGPGIPSEHLPYIFDAFYRVDKSRSRETGGSGLGLSIVKTMVETCGGTIHVESDGKSGTVFTVILPK